MNNQITSLVSSHLPVMLNEILKISTPLPNKKFIDCTFGGGGYSKEILKFSNTYIKAIDRDKKTAVLAKKLEKKFPKRFKFYQIKFSQLDTISNDYVDTIIFDLGLSSIQLDDLERGFSFKSNKKLNMTMGINEISALEVINNLDEEDLKLIIKILGDEKEASKITGYNKESAIALGAYWRYGDALCPGVLFEIKDYAIGITYDLTASKLLPATNTMGAVEITFRMQSNNQFLYKGYNPK